MNNNKKYTKKELNEMPKWKLLTIALEDLERCEKDDGYVIDMNEWVEFDYYSDTCAVCMAGAVMVMSDKSYIIGDNRMEYRYAGFINDCRRLIENRDAPMLYRIPRFMINNFNKTFKEIRNYFYKNNPEGFKEEMKRLIKFFKKHNY